MNVTQIGTFPQAHQALRYSLGMGHAEIAHFPLPRVSQPLLGDRRRRFALEKRGAARPVVAAEAPGIPRRTAARACGAPLCRAICTRCQGVRPAWMLRCVASISKFHGSSRERSVSVSNRRATQRGSSCLSTGGAALQTPTRRPWTSSNTTWKGRKRTEIDGGRTGPAPGPAAAAESRPGAKRPAGSMDRWVLCMICVTSFCTSAELPAASHKVQVEMHLRKALGVDPPAASARPGGRSPDWISVMAAQFGPRPRKGTDACVLLLDKACGVHVGVYFNNNVRAVAVDHATRAAASSCCARRRRIPRRARGVFSVDLFNEGVDLPALDTVLMLNRTVVVFLQQLGHSLRVEPGGWWSSTSSATAGHFLFKPRTLLKPTSSLTRRRRR